MSSSSLVDFLHTLPQSENCSPPEEVAARSLHALEEFTVGYKDTLESLVEGNVRPDHNDDLVLFRDLEFYSLSETDLLPFFGTMHIAYIPAGRTIALQQIPAIVQMYARRLSNQERLTREVADAIEQTLLPKGVCVMTSTHHLSMLMRGQQDKKSATVCSCMKGDFRHKPKVRVELMGMLESSFRS